MAGRTLDGKEVARRVRQEVAAGLKRLGDERAVVATLASVSVGDDRRAGHYVQSLERLAAELGIRFRRTELPAGADSAQVVAVLDALGSDPEVDGIVLQLPLPPPLNQQAMIERLDPLKDVDGIHPVNLGRLAMKRRDPLFVSATALAVQALLEVAGAQLRGAEAVVVGRSNLVGLPTALLLLAADATVTIAHSMTSGLGAVTRRADVLISAAGSPGLITGEMVKPGAIAVDVGVTAIDDPASPRGYRLVGDLAFEEVRTVAESLTPVPGGVGPVTVAMLMRNTLTAAVRRALAGSH